jgi:DNA-binding response OmpR family regulator
MSADIFIVDDNPGNLALLAGILRQAGYGVRAANDGQQAIAAVRARAPDLVMLDIQMPVMDGYEVCRLLKANALTASIPVVFISALDGVFDKVRAFAVGGADYVTKPFESAEVVARVENQLGIQRLRHELEARNHELHARGIELERRNDELARANTELLRAQQRTHRVFTALADALPGTCLDGKLRLEERIGEGGFGVVYKAVQLESGRLVAVKVLRPGASNETPSGVDRFRAEAETLRRLDHENTVRILDFDLSVAGTPYLVMELLDGETLRSELKRGPIAPGRAADLVLPVCEVLVSAHLLGIVHRDMKPSNVFLHRQAGTEIVKILDFGIAKLVEDASDALDDVTLTAGFAGTPEYMAPERVENTACDGQADLYSVGVMLYEMLAGRVPFERRGEGAYAVALMHVRREPEPLRTIAPGVPIELERLVAWALRKDPNERPTVGQFADALRAFRARMGT